MVSGDGRRLSPHLDGVCILLDFDCVRFSGDGGFSVSSHPSIQLPNEMPTYLSLLHTIRRASSFAMP